MTSAVLCLALAIFHESRGEPIKGQYAVAEVVLNRADATGKTVCDVVKEPHQFSWFSKKGLRKPKKEKEAWERSIVIAEESVKDRTNYTKGAKYFNASYMGVRFNKKKKLSVGKHVFF